jgi:hypothetical protein
MLIDLCFINYRIPLIPVAFRETLVIIAVLRKILRNFGYLLLSECDLKRPRGVETGVGFSRDDPNTKCFVTISFDTYEIVYRVFGSREALYLFWIDGVSLLVMKIIIRLFHLMEN